MTIFKKEEIGYWVVGVIFLFAIFTSLFFSIRFIARELNVAINIDLLKKTEVVKFNLDQIDKLGIRRIE